MSHLNKKTHHSQTPAGRWGKCTQWFADCLPYSLFIKTHTYTHPPAGIISKAFLIGIINLSESHLKTIGSNIVIPCKKCPVYTGLFQ